MPTPRPRPRRTWAQRLVLTFMVAVGATAGVSAVALSYASSTVGSIPRAAYGGILAEQPADGEPLNFLLVGADSVATLPEDHPLRNTREASLFLTDTLIILRVDPATGEASVLSIPRDLWVPISGYDQSSKINAIFARTDRLTLAQTIQDYLGLPIHNVVQVDFNGFLRVIEVIGGIEVYVTYPLQDVDAQLSITETGCVQLTPEQALGYVRSRTLLAYVDGTWQRVDGRSDLARIERQQDFLVIALQKAFDNGARNPAKLKTLIDEVSGNGLITLDDRLTPAQIFDLAREFQSFRADSLQKYTLPVVLGTEGKQSVVRMLEAEAQPVLDVFRGVTSRDEDARIAVRNGTGEAGLATRVGSELEVAGFTVSERTDAESFTFTRTVIRHDAGQGELADLLRRWMVNGADLEVRTVAGGPIEIVVGSDYGGLLAAPTEAAATPTPGADAPTPSPSASTPRNTSGEQRPEAEVRAC